MKKHSKRIRQCRAADVMTRDVLTVRSSLAAVDAANFLFSHGLTGVPVVDEQNRCVGVFSALDFTRVSRILAGTNEPPTICPFQMRHRLSDGRDVTLCTLPAGLCSLQGREFEENQTRTTCCSPNEIVVEWQSLQPRLSPTDPVRRWMSAEPITVRADTSLADCASRMARARIHRLVVLDDDQQIVGLISSIDIMKAIGDGRIETIPKTEN